MMEIQYLGNKELLKLHKTAFLAASTIPPEMVLKCYDWAVRMAKEEQCVISGFSSKLERDVLHFLIKAKCPAILVLARRMYSKLPEELIEPLNQGRLLIVTTFNSPRQTRVTALIRNKYVCEKANRVLIVTANSKSSLISLAEEFKSKQIILSTD